MFGPMVSIRILARRVALALVASLALAAPAMATGGFFCEGGDGVEVSFATGRVPVLHILGAHAAAGDKAYATESAYGEGEPFVVGQAFADDDGVNVDFTDPNFEGVLVKVRLRWDGTEDWPLTGTMELDGKSYELTCGAE